MRLIILLLMGGIFPLCLSAQFLAVDFNASSAKKEVEVYMEGQLFTKLNYADSLPIYTLYPLYSASGVEVTHNGFSDKGRNTSVKSSSLQGFWFALGYVNEVDFRPVPQGREAADRCRYGEIRLTEAPVLDRVHACITVHAEWRDCHHEVLLKEKTRFYFDGSFDSRTVRRETHLTAYQQDVILGSKRNGGICLRLGDSFNPSNGGHFRNADHVEGEEVWGKHSSWVSITGKKEEREITITLFDVAGNRGYPARAETGRDGLFSLNNLENSESAENEIPGILLKKGETLTFRHFLTLSESSLP